jgi:sec-independent protein translocase protein TatA
MFGLGTSELLIILVLVLVIFGAGKLPQVGASLGKGLRSFKEGIKGEDEQPATVDRSVSTDKPSA